MLNKNLKSAFGSILLLPLCSMVLAVAACENPSAQDPSLSSLEMAEQSLDTIELVRHIRTLASDSFMGRAPASKGEEMTIDYLEREFLFLGYGVAGEDALLQQEVPLVSITPDPDMSLTISGNRTTRDLSYGSQFVAVTPEARDGTDLDDTELIFAGYGIVAPHYGWNDYEGVDVEGKTVVVLANDPGFATRDPEMFQGNAMTYYGRWTYKYEEADRQGAAGVFIIHDTEAAGYPWATVENGWTGTRFNLAADPGEPKTLEVEGWLSYPAAEAVFQQAGLNLQQLETEAATRGFRAVPMPLTASVAIQNTLERSVSRNLLARLDGTLRSEEVVIYMAHWDHLGVDPGMEGDSIFHGALDNASGVAALLELAKAFTHLYPPPQRSIVFMATTAEEQGLLGSEHYMRNPLHPPEQTVAVINIDGLPIWGPTHDYMVVGHGRSELDEYARRAAEAQGRSVAPDPEPEKGYFFRADHFSFAKWGIPTHFGRGGFDIVGRGEEYGRTQWEEWVGEHYHQPSDRYSEDWVLGGALQDLSLWLHMGVDLAYSSEFPNWYEHTEFKAVRDAMLEGRE
jgi:Zn-dependent M28 family amino/carboxypeptidase